MGLFWGGGFSSSDNDDDGPSFLVIMLVSMLVYVISFLLMQALSRYREFAADRGSAVITGRPSALASALLKISGINERIPTEDLRVASQMQAFFISPVGHRVTGLFATHPPIEKRVAALERLEAQLQGTSLAAAAA
jgi:heat shock protein HtpX